MDTIIGQTFRAWDGNTYVCDSSDENGLWMTRVDAPEANKADLYGEWRRNVSPRVIGRTYHPVRHSDDTMNDIVDAARKIRELQSEQNRQRPGESDEDFESRAFDTLDVEYEWIGGITYKGNSVSWIKSKADANGRALLDAWEALREVGGICDGQTRLADAIRKLKPHPR